MPRASEGGERLVEGGGRAERANIALRALQHGVGRGEALAREHRRPHAVPRRVARVIRLRHRAEVLLEPGGERRRDPERVPRRLGVEQEQTTGRRGAAERADRRRRVPAADVVIGVERAADGGVDLEAEHVRERERAAVRHLRFAGGQRGGEQRHARVTHQREVRVVEVVRVSRDAVGERGPRRRRAERRADDRRERHAAFDADRTSHDRGRWLARARQHHAQRIERRAPHARESLGRDIVERGLDDELGETCGRAHVETIADASGPGNPGATAPIRERRRRVISRRGR